MAKNQYSVLATKTMVGKDGKKNGVYAQCSDGETRTFLNPHGKGAKYAAELKNGVRITNLGERKKDKSGNSMRLTDTQAAFRSGYLSAQKDSANAYKAKKAKKSGESGGKRGKK